MIVYMSGTKHPEVDEEELKFYGYEKCEDYCHTYCSYYRFGKCYKCAFYKDYKARKGVRNEADN